MPVDDDGHARDLAMQIERGHSQWVVVWGVYSREYWAFACFDVPQGIIMHSVDPNELVRQMREVELRAAAGRQTMG